MRINALGNTATDFASDDYIAIDGTTNGSRKMKNDSLLKVTAQNALAGNVAPAFDPTKPNDAGGYAYYANEIVAYQGATYKFKVNHSRGAWNAAEVDRYDAGESLKFFNVVDVPGYLFALEDKDKVFLLGIKKDGSVDWQKGVPTPIKKIFETIVAGLSGKVNKEAGKSLIDAVFSAGLKFASDEFYLLKVLDKNDVFLFGVKKDGSFDWQKGVPAALNIFLEKEKDKSLVDSVHANSLGHLYSSKYLEFITDALGSIIYAVSNSGVFEFFSRVRFKNGIDWSTSNLTELEQALKDSGFTGGQGDWSDSKSLSIHRPKCAIVNFSGITAMPTSKTEDLNGVMQFWDLQGNYFKKNVVMNAQGNSSLAFPKKNCAIDICNDAWIGDDAFKLKIGDWVVQDSFHLKAYYTEYIRGKAVVGYDLFDKIVKTRGEAFDAPWKQALINQDALNSGKGLNFSVVSGTDLQMDTGARNHPLGFPCIVYLNGEFYGIFAWQLKKHRDNYHMVKSNLKQVHLDGELGIDEIWDGSIDWTAFEVRNPSGLKDVDGNKYDGDNPKELSGTDPKSAEVKGYIEALSGVSAILDATVSSYGSNSPEFKAAFENVFDVDNLIDYIIFMDVLGDHDAFKKNWQWTTYDGVKWWVNPYDLDGSFGSEAGGQIKKAPYTGHVVTTHGLPTSYIFECSDYNTRLEARYAELRDKEIIDAHNISYALVDYCLAVGIDNYKKEYDASHWGNSPCNKDAEIDSHWELVHNADGSPVMGNSPTYSSSTNYSVNDEVYDGQSSYMGYYKFKCVENSVGNRPFKKSYFKDNIYSTVKWIEEEISNMDELYGYNN